jgi:hypothetical protein
MKTSPAAYKLGLFECDVIPALESMSESELRETALGLRAILTRIAKEPARRIAAKEEWERRAKSLEMRKWIREMAVSE